MPFIPAPNIVQVEVRALFDSQQVENVFTIDALTAVTPTIVTNIATLVAGWAGSQYFPLLPEAISLTETFARDLTTSDGAQATIVPDPPVVGGNGTTPAPNETTFCVSLRSASSGRSARGRKYVLGLNKELVTGNHINATLRGQFVSVFDSLRADIATEGWQWVVVSYRHAGAVRPGGPVYYPITTVVSVDDVVDSQRRRKPGNGS